MDLPNGRISWFVYVVRLGDAFYPTAARLDLEGDDVTWNWLRPVLCPHSLAARLPDFRHGLRHALPNTEWSAARSLALPFFNNLKTAEIDEVCQTFQELVQAAPD